MATNISNFSSVFTIDELIYYHIKLPNRQSDSK